MLPICVDGRTRWVSACRRKRSSLTVLSDYIAQLGPIWPIDSYRALRELRRGNREMLGIVVRMAGLIFMYGSSSPGRIVLRQPVEEGPHSPSVH